MYKRHRRLRSSIQMRNLVKDVYLEKSDLIYPIFIEEGENIKSEISSMPGIYRYSLDRLPEELEEDRAAGMAETEEAVFSFLTLGGFPAVKVEMKDESGATIWVDLDGKGWLLLGGDGMTGAEIEKLLGKVNLKGFAGLVR